MNEAQRHILQMLQDGAITAEEANRLLAALGGSEETTSAAADSSPAAAETPAAEEPAVDVPPAEVPPPDDPLADAPPVDTDAVAAMAAGSVEQVLRQLSAGELTAEEANALLADAPVPVSTATETASPLPPADPAETPTDALPVEEAPASPAGDILMPPDLDRFRRMWQIPFAIALGFVVLSALCMSAAQGVPGFFGAVGFLCAWSAFMIAAVAVAIAFWSRTARWVHVRIQEQAGKRIAVSLPVPLRLVNWLTTIARPFVDEETRGHMDMTAEFIDAMKEEMNRPDAEPLIVDVDDEGQQVQVYFG